MTMTEKEKEWQAALHSPGVVELNLNELRILTGFLAEDETTRYTPLADKIRLTLFDMENFLSAAGLPPYSH